MFDHFLIEIFALLVQFNSIQSFAVCLHTSRVSKNHKVRFFSCNSCCCVQLIEFRCVNLLAQLSPVFVRFDAKG